MSPVQEEARRIKNALAFISGGMCQLACNKVLQPDLCCQVIDFVILPCLSRDNTFSLCFAFCPVATNVRTNAEQHDCLLLLDSCSNGFNKPAFGDSTIPLQFSPLGSWEAIAQAATQQ